MDAEAPEPLDEVVENIQKLKLVKVEVVLSKVDPKNAQFSNPNLLATFIRGHLWPRLTFDLNGKTIKVSITDYNQTQKRKIDAWNLDPIEMAVWKIVAGKRETKKIVYKNRYYPFMGLVGKIKKKVRHKIYVASKKKSHAKRVSGKLRQEDRQKALEEVRAVFKRVIGVLREQDIYQVWKEEKDLRVVAEVMES